MNDLTPRKRQATWRKFDEIRRSTCGHCPTGCGVKGFVKNGELVDLFGDEDHSANKGSYCPKGLLSWVFLNHPDRITRPRMRKSLRQPFREVSWDEAQKFVALQIAALTKASGPDSVVVHADDTSPFGHYFGGTRFAQAIGTRNGPASFQSAPFGKAGRIAKMFGIGADQMLMNSQRDWANSRCILVVGSDPGVTDPVTLGPLVDVRDRGGSLIVIDSKTTISAVKASYFVRVNLGTEATFLAGVCSELIKNESLDDDFIKLTTIGFDQFREFVAAYTADKVTNVCGVSEEDIKTVAKTVGAAHPMQVMCGDWSTRDGLDDDLLGLCAAIVCLRGSVGIPGGGLNLLNVSPFARAEEESLHFEELLLGENTTSAVFFHGNPVARMAGGNELRKRLSCVPLVVQFGGFDDETSGQAHVQLPLTTWLEESGLITFNNGRAVQWRDKVVDPRGESRPVLDIWVDIAGACQLQVADAGKERGVALAERAAESALRKNPLTSAMSVAALKSDKALPGGILWPCTKPDDAAYEDDRFIRGDVRGRNILFRRNQKFPGSEGRFAGDIDKIDLSRVKLVSTAASDSGALSKNGSGTLKMVATVGVDYIPAWSGAAPTPSRAPTPTIVRIHPHTALAYGLRTGSSVVVANAHGEFTGRADLSLTVAADVVWCIITPGFVGQTIGPFALFDIPKQGNPRASWAAVRIQPGSSDWNN